MEELIRQVAVLKEASIAGGLAKTIELAKSPIIGKAIGSLGNFGRATLSPANYAPLLSMFKKPYVYYPTAAASGFGGGYLGTNLALHGLDSQNWNSPIPPNPFKSPH